MRLKELTITKTRKMKDPSGDDRFDRIEVGITKTYTQNTINGQLIDDTYDLESIKEDIERELQILASPDPKWIREGKPEGDKNGKTS